MKKKLKILSFLLLINIGAFAQKDEIKNAQSYYDKGKVQEALTILKKIEYLIINASDDIKSDFFYLKGNVYKELAIKNIDPANNFSLAAGAYQDVLLYENDSHNYKYAFKANLALKELKSKLVDGAHADYKAGKFKESADKSYEVYLFDKKDTLNLLNAAAAALTGKDYISSIKYYEELKKINYSGKAVVFYATNKKTKTEEAFSSISARDSNIKEGLYEKPRNVFPPSKKEDILIALGFSYLERNDYVNSEKYYQEALQINPSCVNCCINLVYIKMQLKNALVDQMDTLGNTPKEMKEYDKLNIQKDEIIKSAIPYLKKALVIEPKNEDAVKSLLGIYRALDMTNEYNALKSSR
ncbi:tetratricopeptide repeat protein [Flavobacterium piscis]|uniref:Tetratricopeptide (TPR) repeat protein n=1 Tax=Flavobacterium piscis TaxID=1114874 RepID=A0ABU1YC04_9FLAO|nr:tetratricopeptide repeat protein [Flavobacterium piscis]MDR7211150.1 tetratricopeptide (TPR) repeat protein [Flavobacterium piscis]